MQKLQRQEQLKSEQHRSEVEALEASVAGIRAEDDSACLTARQSTLRSFLVSEVIHEPLPSKPMILEKIGRSSKTQKRIY